ncbi:MAG TPA: hypothetical protein VL137_09405, partial [Polyangiaceae bacterium]|nr:hypothetical protein [Polyangiaceae bacterium]
LVPLDPEFRDSIYKLSMIPAGEDVGAWLKGHGYQATDSELTAAARYKSQQFLVIEIDSKTIEIAGTDRALLSPIRFVTQQPVNVASTLGLSNIKDKQELLVYVIDPTSRYEVANYPSVFAPTNLHVDFSTKERMGELYAGLHDLLLSKNPGAFVNEYAWSTKGCGQPCANSPLSLAELISLGADAAEAQVPKEELTPKPPEMTDDEKAAYKKLKPKEKKELDAQRKEVARRKALMERNQEFVLSRMHYRYGASDLKNDIELKAAPAIEGGIGAPKEGPKGEISTEVKPTEKENRLQSRMINLHESPSQVQCKGRERYRWGKAPRTYHGLRKIWVAEDLANRNRTLFKLPEVIETPIPALGLVPVAAKVALAAAPAPSAAPAEKKEEKKDSSCSIAGAPGRGTGVGFGGLMLGALASVLLARRRSFKR